MVWLTIVSYLTMVTVFRLMGKREVGELSLFDGEAAYIYKDGKFNLRAMRKERYSLTDFLQQLHEKEVKGLQDLEYALLESSGKLSAFKKDQQESTGIVYDLILYGVLQKNMLRQSGLTEADVLAFLKTKGYDGYLHVFYLSIDSDNYWFLKSFNDVLSSAD